jgi:hypothetical protein
MHPFDADKPLNARIPISKICPACGASEHKKVQPASMIAFTDDRVCAKCSTRYAPPTPAWARGVFAVVGLLFLLGAVVAGVGAVIAPERALRALTIAVPLSLVWIGCWYVAFRSEQQRTPQGGRTDEEEKLPPPREPTDTAP